LVAGDLVATGHAPARKPEDHHREDQADSQQLARQRDPRLPGYQPDQRYEDHADQQHHRCQGPFGKPPESQDPVDVDR
jgi:hypothetical protein